MKKSSKPKKRPPRISSIYLGSNLDIYELERHASLSGAGSVSALIRILNNRMKAQFRNHLTMLEEAILAQADDGNNELTGLHQELRAEFASLKPETIKLALASLTHRGYLIEAQRGGKSESARGAVTRCWFPKGHKLASDFQLTHPNGDDDA
jgi:hypothetical protein